MATLFFAFEASRWLFSQDLGELIQIAMLRGTEGLSNLQSLGGLKWAVCGIFGPIPPIGMIVSAVTYFVVRDTLEGKYTRDVAVDKKVGAAELAAPDVQGSAIGPNGLSMWQRLQLAVMCHVDSFGGALITMVFYGLIPCSMAS